GLMARIGWQNCLILIASVTAFTGGVLFALLELHRLGRGASGNATTLAQDTSDASQSIRLTAIASLRRIMLQYTENNDPYPHHEDYPESPGQDQGQLTSRLPGSTPLLEELATAYRKLQQRTATKRTL
ncbi:MAG TPA: hypothetical protein VEV17_02420, partial [Bryobacteraceae bacterium]|nr:hypothetical protein [Bryobacteraceae bacterium]